ncbi:MAG: DUF4337 domain-containing protein, partial [Hyphomicrobium sp.]
MAWDQLSHDADTQNAKRRDKLIGVFIGLLAVVLAVCSMGAGNSAQDATLKNIESSNTWAFFQAKNIRRHTVRLQADDLALTLAANPAMSEDAKKLFKDKIESYRELDKRLTSEPDKKEGLDELFLKAKALETSRDEALKRGPYFDYGQALLQIAIVLASIASISGGNMLLIASACVGVFGVIATIGGFTLAFPLPFA